MARIVEDWGCDDALISKSVAVEVRQEVLIVLVL
jgi:hypothetical protein